MQVYFFKHQIFFIEKKKDFHWIQIYFIEYKHICLDIKYFSLKINILY